MNAATQHTIISGDLIERLMLDADGAPMAEDSPELIAAEAAGQKSELVACGHVQFQIIDPAATALGIATGAIESATDPMLCMRVHLLRGDDDPELVLGSYVRVLTDGADMALWFRVQWTHADAQAPNPYAQQGEDWVQCDAALDCLGCDEILLVQVIDVEGEFGAVA